jgi:hypothetical protein
MTKLSWGTPGERFYESGIDRGVVYVDNVGYAWNGLTSVQESPTGGDPQPYYLDGYKYVQVSATEDFEATLEAYSSPREFGPCDGSTELYSGLTATQQKRKQFSLAYRTKVGDDLTGLDRGYKIHLVYNALAAPSGRNNQTVSDNIELTTLSWTISTQPPTATGFRPTSHFIVDTRRASAPDITALEDILYGTDALAPRFPTVTELLAIFA